MVSIVDVNGQPISTADIAEPQTAKLQWLQHEWQGHPSRGLTPSRLAQILIAAEQGDIIEQYQLFEDMEEKDAHIASEMSKRRRAISLLDFTIQPPRNPSAQEKKATDQLRELLAEVEDIEEITFDTTDAIGKGFVNQEIEWDRQEGTWFPKTITHRPQEWFRLVRGYRQEMRLRDGGGPDGFGSPLNTFGWISHTHKAKSGYIERAALFRVLVWPYLFKNYTVADLAEFLEIYGIPLRIGKYPSGANPQEKATLLRALVNIGHNAAGIMPDSMAVDFQKAAEGDPGAFELMIDWCERSVSKAVLGATLTSQSDRGSNTNALGKVHNEVRKDLRDDDAKKIARTLTRDLLYPMAALNGLAPNGIRRSPRFVYTLQEAEDITVYATALPTLVNLGMKIDRKQAQEKLGFEEPESDADLLKPTQSAPAELKPSPVIQNSDLAAATAQIAAAARAALTGDPPQQMAPLLDASLQPATDAWINSIKSLVDRAKSLEDVRDGLLALAPNMKLDQYSQAMRQALAAAALAGRFEILREAGAGG